MNRTATLYWLCDVFSPMSAMLGPNMWGVVALAGIAVHRKRDLTVERPLGAFDIGRAKPPTRRRCPPGFPASFRIETQ